VSSLIPPGDDEFDRAPRAPQQPTELSGYDRDLDRATTDRLSSTGGLVSIAYWIARGVALAFAFVARAIRGRSGT
jgi:hypothetical protein